jgi:hypothetical protein
MKCLGWCIICTIICLIFSSIAFLIGKYTAEPSFEKCASYMQGCQIKMIHYNPHVYRFICED